MGKSSLATKHRVNSCPVGHTPVYQKLLKWSKIPSELIKCFFFGGNTDSYRCLKRNSFWNIACLIWKNLSMSRRSHVEMAIYIYIYPLTFCEQTVCSGFSGQNVCFIQKNTYIYERVISEGFYPPFCTLDVTSNLILLIKHVAYFPSLMQSLSALHPRIWTQATVTWEIWPDTRRLLNQTHKISSPNFE